MLQKLNAEPSGKFENFCRMSATEFEFLLAKVGPHISKRDTPMRKCIPPQERLAVTLRYLATGDSFVSLGYLFKMSNQVVSNIVHEVCAAIIEELKGEIRVSLCNFYCVTLQNYCAIQKIEKLYSLYA